jgi:hypothetical protein
MTANRSGPISKNPVRGILGTGTNNLIQELTVCRTGFGFYYILCEGGGTIASQCIFNFGFMKVSRKTSKESCGEKKLLDIYIYIYI